MRPFAEWLEFHAAARPDHPALVHEDQALDYAALAARARQLARWLRDERGLQPGARVAWLGANAPDQLALLFACAYTGLILLPLNWRLSDAEIAAILADAGVALAILDVSTAERAAALAAVPVVRARHGDGPRLPAAATVAFDGAPPDPAQGVLLVYTSGTTGSPKGALLTQAALASNAVNAVHMHDLSADDRVLTVLPMFHVGGLNIQTLPALSQGATVLLETRFDPTRTLARIACERPTLTVQVPATLAALIAHPDWAATDLGSLRACATGSTDVPLPLIEALHVRGLPVIQIYGATETGPVAIYQRIEEAFSHAGGIGRRGLETEIRLVDEQGNDVPDGTPGEVLVRGAHCALGYWHAARGAAEPFADGWFASGDVAERDADGYYWFKDRRKHVIISGGENIYPAELERVLAASGRLREAAVAGRPDPHWGQVPVVVAVQGREPLAREEVLALFDGRIARYKQPKDVVFVEALPRNAMGKVEVVKLRELARG
ncbi:MAG: AMP-binding protein [Gammaproteobacteria bacterium]|nr:AMP-binding protein [Gammaproteobacteria bacterium]